MKQLNHAKKRLSGVVIATILVALCCFTPILIIALAGLGLGTLTAYLDFFLFPALFILLGLSCLAYRAYQQECDRCALPTNTKEEPHERV